MLARPSPVSRATSYPTGVAAVPIEVVEASAPVRFLRKSLRAGSGRPWRADGGLGQTIEFTVDTERSWQLNAVTSRLAIAPEGIFGGEAGAAGAFSSTANPITTQARVTLQPGDVVRLDLPGWRRLRRAATGRAATARERRRLRAVGAG